VAQRQEEERQQKAREIRKQEEQRKMEEKKREKEMQKQREMEMLRRQKEMEQWQKRTRNYERLGDAWEEDDSLGTGSVAEVSAYHYYDADKIRNSMKISPEQMAKGDKLIKEGKLVIEEITSGHLSNTNESTGQLLATGTFRREEFPLRIYFTRDKILTANCNCPKCRDWYYSWANPGKVCDYKAGAISYLSGYLSRHNLGDATDRRAKGLLNAFRRGSTSRSFSSEAKKDAVQKLQPRLIKKGNELELSFKFGENKMFVVKNLENFCEHVSKGEEATYGSNTRIQHDLDRFDESSKKWFRLIRQIVQEEQALNQKIEDSRYYGNGFAIGNTIDLFGWRLDAFYDRLKEAPIDYEDWDQDPKKKGRLTSADKNPRITIKITPNEERQSKIFHGIHVRSTLPELYIGSDTAYYLEDLVLNRLEDSFYQKLEPLERAAMGKQLSMDIGRNNLSEFYYHVLPELKEIAEISERNAEKIYSYLLPEARYTFYLDASEDEVYAEPFVHYGEQEYSLLDFLEDSKADAVADYRDAIGEQSVLMVLLKYLKNYDAQHHLLHNNGDEDAAYQLYAHGIQELQQYGEVHCTRSFLDLRRVRKVKASVGVSVSEGMLNLKITTEDFSEEELLNILRSYRQKKHYYRLKDGSFVNLEDDTLSAMAELTDVLHLKASDFKKENLKIPMYRALYLDKLLEDNEELYEDRDRVIAHMAHQFRAIEDTDYEVPKSLKKIMRNYQKEGFKWLKTLESWGFGGILADEMGLGKTLQAISLLLSAKEEGRTGPSLIVCPASLVYNWEEEIHRFAPALHVRTVTGTQEERKAILTEEGCDVLVTSYDLLKRDIGQYENREFDIEIIDEAQYIKNHSTAAAKSVKVIKSRIRFALTGTPVENRLSELWSIFDYLMPGFLYGYETFRKEYEIPIVKNEDQESMQRLQRLTGPFILRRRKEDVLKDLPEKLEEVRYVRLEEKQQRIYDGQVVQIRQTLNNQSEAEFSQNKLQILAALTRLRQICCDPSLCLENYDGETAKTDACMELIQGAIEGGHRMLVFSQFTSMLDILKERLQKEGIDFFVLTGSTSKEERRELVRKFNEGTVPVFLISLKAGGVGLNLTGADLVIHYDPWWNLAAQNQATDRAHRIGQTKKVTVYKLIAKDTIEEKILKLQEKKRELADQILNGEGTSISTLNREEILDILEGSK
jgi:SNF2 family DNA or RNA helicase